MNLWVNKAHCSLRMDLDFFPQLEILKSEPSKLEDCKRAAFDPSLENKLLSNFFFPLTTAETKEAPSTPRCRESIQEVRPDLISPQGL